MPRADNTDTNQTAQRPGTSRHGTASIPRVDSGVTGVAPLVPAHRELLREAQSNIARPYFSTVGLLRRSTQRVHSQTGGEPEESPEPSHQEPHQEPHPLPSTSEWSHSRVQVTNSVAESQNTNTDSGTPNNPSVCASFHVANHTTYGKARDPLPNGA